MSAVTFEQLRTNVMNMKFWDRCLEEEIVTDAGFIRKCMVRSRVHTPGGNPCTIPLTVYSVNQDEVYDGVTVSDKLRDLFVNPDTEYEGVYEEVEQKEFMYHVMKRIVTGGPLSQFDDSWTDYKEVAKGL